MDSGYTDFRDFDRKMTQATNIFFLAIADAIQDQLLVEERNYPVETIRRYGRGKTGKVAGSPRDVVDSKRLYNSFVYKFLTTSKGFSANYSYSVGYASLIYMGLISPGGYQVPPYPWIEIAIDKLDLEQLFVKAWQQAI